MRLAFIALDDAEDVTSWSGTPYHVLQEIRRHGMDAEVISPLERPFKYCYAPQKALQGSAEEIYRSIVIHWHCEALRRKSNAGSEASKLMRLFLCRQSPYPGFMRGPRLCTGQMPSLKEFPATMAGLSQT